MFSRRCLNIGVPSVVLYFANSEHSSPIDAHYRNAMSNKWLRCSLLRWHGADRHVHSKLGGVRACRLLAGASRHRLGHRHATGLNVSLAWYACDLG